MRMIIYFILFILLLLSLHDDLTTGISLDKSNPSVSNKQDDEFEIVKIIVQTGDTALSIIEELNSEYVSIIDMKKFLTDFEKINNIHPHQLQTNQTYYFPVYD